MNVLGPSRPSATRRPPAGLDKRKTVPASSLSAGLFAGLAQADVVLLAVSGGPDSMALMLLAQQWTAGLGPGRPVLQVATVDHGLREESAWEATFVADAAARLGLPHRTLPWIGPKPSRRILERARDARYALLADHAHRIGAAHILTAHHADDQAETILMRLGRGSGVRGLAGMRRETEIAPGLTLVRPLLGLRKADLVAACRQAGQTFVEDPSNDDPAYARARLRAKAAVLADIGLDTSGLLRLARRMARAEDALEAEARRLEAMMTPERRPGLYRVGLAGARAAEAEILLRLLRRAIKDVAAEDTPIRLDRLEALTDAVAAALAAGRAYRSTLGGARIRLARDTMITVTPEPRRRRGRAFAEGAR